jgi:branched-chain amino acid transport system substrate-binding protein
MFFASKKNLRYRPIIKLCIVAASLGAFGALAARAAPVAGPAGDPSKSQASAKTANNPQSSAAAVNNPQASAKTVNNPQSSAAAVNNPPLRLALVEGLSGPFANAGEAVFRNLVWAVERVNARGGARLAQADGSFVARRLELLRFDSKGQTEEALSAFRAALDQKADVILQGNSSATAAALIDAVNKHNEREPSRRVLFLNYSAVEPSLTNERCSPWHFRFDAHADMRLAALTDVLKEDSAVKRLYLIGQDYSFGQHVLRKGREMVTAKRPDIQIVGDELHPLGRIRDFLPYATKIKASGAQAVLTGNFGSDLTLLIKAAREVGYDGKFYTFYANALGAPAAIGEAGVGRVLAVNEWHPNVAVEPASTPAEVAVRQASERFYLAFRNRYPDPRDDYVHARMHAMIEMYAAAVEKARSVEAASVSAALAGARFEGKAVPGAGGGLLAFHSGWMRAGDHQFIQPMRVSVMQRVAPAGTAPGANVGDPVRFDVEGSGYGFRTVRFVGAAATEQPHSCVMSVPR